jgi:hypothetical protein
LPATVRSVVGIMTGLRRAGLSLDMVLVPSFFDCWAFRSGVGLSAAATRATFDAGLDLPTCSTRKAPSGCFPGADHLPVVSRHSYA